MTASMQEALQWLRAHGGEGVKARQYPTPPRFALLAGGTIRRFHLETWQKLVDEGYCEWYADNKRIRIVRLTKGVHNA